METTKNCTVYYTNSGYIMGIVRGWEDEVLAKQYNSISSSGFVSSLIHYVKDGNILEKSDWVPEVDVNSILNIPVGSKVFVKGGEYTVNDGVFELEKPASYKVKVIISPVTHLSKEITI